jgi:hypothetical protein
MRAKKFAIIKKGGNSKMLKKFSSIPFAGTPEQEEQLNAVIEKNKDDKSMLMHVMQEAQGIYGYLPYEVQVMIAECMDVPLERFTEYQLSTHSSHFLQRVSTTFQFVLVQLVMLRVLRTLLTRLQNSSVSDLMNVQKMVSSHLRLVVVSVLAVSLLFLQ